MVRFEWREISLCKIRRGIFMGWAGVLLSHFAGVAWLKTSLFVTAHMAATDLIRSAKLVICRRQSLSWRKVLTV